MIVKRWLVVAAALVASFGLPGSARAVDAPKWVAAIFIQGQNSVGLRWSPVPGASGYKVLRSATSGSGHVELASVAQPQHFDPGVEAGETYYYVLQAVAGAETSAPSDERAVTIPGQRRAVTLPPVLKDPVLSQSTEFGKTASKVLVGWAASSGKAVAYNIYRSLVSGKDYQMLGSNSELQYVDAAVEIGKTYYYVVSALDETFQETPMSKEVSIAVTEPEKREASREKKEKTPLLLRGAKVIAQIRQGPWGKFKDPVAVALNSDGELHVLDSGSSSVFVFDARGEFLYHWGKMGAAPGELRFPLDMAIDSNDNIYISNMDPRVEIFNAKGEPISSVPLKDIIGDDGKEHTIGGVTCGPESWFISDDKQFLVYEVSYRNKLIRTIGEPFTEEHKAMKEKPLGVMLGPKKMFYSNKRKALVVADTYNFRVQVFGDDGQVTGFGTYGNSVGQFSRAIAVCEGPDGEAFAPDFGNSTAQAFDLDGKFLYVMGVEDRSGQFPLGGNTGCVFAGKRVYMAEKVAGLINIAEFGDEITKPVKVKK